MVVADRMLKIGSRNLAISRAHVFFNNRRQFSTTNHHHNSSKIQGKVALITGAATGIGKETASKFIQNGAKVVIADINRQLGQDTAAKLGPDATFVHCDVSNEDDVAGAVDYVVSKHGKLDIMYNNAGISCRMPPSIADLDLTAFDRIIAVNVRGVMAGMKHASRVMIPRKSGSIICTGSVTGIMGGLAQHTYSISKSGYCTFLGGNLVTWRSKKQNVVSRSSAEAEFRAMALGICELLWLKIILDDLKVRWKGPMKLYCDNKSAIDIAHNPVQHDRTKHIEVDRHFIKEKLDSGLICTRFVRTGDQLADVLTKGLPSAVFQKITSKLGMDDIHSPA